MSNTSTNPTHLNNVTTNAIRYTPTVNWVDFNNPLQLDPAPNVWGESNEIIEKSFVFKFTPNVEDAPNGSSLSTPNVFPFTYLTVPIPLVEEAPDISEDYIDALERVYQYNALYVDATVFYFDSPQGMVGSGVLNGGAGNPLVPGGINFEHFGCIHWREPQPTPIDTQPTTNQYFDSEFVIKNLVNKRQNSQTFGADIPTTDIAESYPIDPSPLFNPINFNYNLSQFECKLSNNPVVNIPDNVNNFGATYSLVIKGKYLLM